MNTVVMVVLSGVMLLIVADIFLRYAFNRPIIGTTEITEFMMVCMLLAMAWCAMEGSHIKIDVIIKRLPPRFQATVDSITFLISLGVFAVLAWQGFLTALYSWDYWVVSSMLDIPEFPVVFILVFGYAILCVAIVPLMIQRIVKAVKR